MLLFFQKAVPATQADVLLSVAGYTAETAEQADRPVSYTRLEVLFTDPITAGDLLVKAYLNGAARGSGVTLNATKTRGSECLSLPTDEGDRIEVKATSTGLAPTTGDLLALIE